MTQNENSFFQLLVISSARFHIDLLYLITKVPPVLEPFSFGSATTATHQSSVTSHTTSTSYTNAKEGDPPTQQQQGDNVRSSLLPGSSRAAGSRTRVICGLARGDLPVRFQWLKDGISLSSSTSSLSTSDNTYFNANNENLFDSSAASVSSPISDNEKYIHNMYMSTTTAKRFIAKDPSDTIQITTIDAFSSLLTISRLGDEHTGNYTCVATNPAGRAQFTASLTVKGDFWQLFCFKLRRMVQKA